MNKVLEADVVVSDELGLIMTQAGGDSFLLSSRVRLSAVTMSAEDLIKAAGIVRKEVITYEVQRARTILRLCTKTNDKVIAKENAEHAILTILGELGYSDLVDLYRNI